MAVESISSDAAVLLYYYECPGVTTVRQMRQLPLGTTLPGGTAGQ